MKRLLSFCFLCVSLYCFGLLSEEQIREADEIGWPANVISVLYGGAKSEEEDFFRQAFRRVEASSLNNE